MAFEDDDLSAMRSALLASMPTKPAGPSKNEEEDLSALRLAALMTRRQNQNQIQVIQPRHTSVPPPPPPRPPAPPLFPGTFHRMMPPPVSHNLISVTQSTPNLISLTPGPEPNNIGVVGPSIVPLMMHFPGMGRPMRPFHRPMRPHIRSMRPRMRSMHPLLRPIRHNQRMPNNKTIQPISFDHRSGSIGTVPRATKAPVAVTTATEVKVSDKFSRYNSDSSSDEDDLHTTEKKKTTSDNEESDAESVASEKSFSSVSEVAKDDTEVEITNKDEEEQLSDNQDEPPEEDTDSEQEEEDVLERNMSDDNISIIDDGEDDILAAIDDFLEDRPEKLKPEKITKVETKKQNATKKQVVMKKPVEKKAIEKIVFEKSPISKPIKPMKRRKSSSSSAKMPVVDKQPTKVQTTPQTAQPIVKKIVKSSTSNGTKASKSTPAPKQKTKASVGGKVTHRENFPPEAENVKIHNNRNPPQWRQSKAKQPSEESAIYNVPVLVKQSAPSPSRQRRDSDLDSVGTSDLSFISSESEDEKVVPVKKPVRRPRTRSVSGNMDSDEEVQIKPSKKRNMQQTIEINHEKTSSVLSARERKTQLISKQPTKTFSNPDLRKKLEKRGLKKETNIDAIVKKMPDETKSNDSLKTLSHVTKTGVISLKKRSRIETKNEERPKSRSSSIENIPRISLPEPEEARRIVITRPNPNATSNRKSSEVLQINTSKSRSRPVLHPKKSLHIKSSMDDKPVKRKNNKDKSVIVMTKTREPPRKKSNILTLKSEKRLKIGEEKIQYKKVAPKQIERSESFEKESSTTEESDSSVSEESEPEVFKEEIFAFNEAEMPEFDDVLGKVDEDSEQEEGEYVYSNRKRSKNSQTKLKKRKKPEVHHNRKMIPDSRRIVPKTDSPHSESDEEKEQIVRKPLKKSVHLRLGIARREEKVAKTQPLRAPVQNKPSWDSDLSHSDSENEYEEPLPRMTQRKDIRSSIMSSVVRTQSKHRILIDDSNNDAARRNDTTEEKHDQKRRKRKILVSGKGGKTTPEQRKMTKRDLNVKERLGDKVVLSAVSVRTRDVETKKADEPRYQPKRKKDVGPAPAKRRKDNFEKASKNSHNDNRYLEARIKRIQQQNGQILRRQKEIEIEKERFGF